MPNCVISRIYLILIRFIFRRGFVLGFFEPWLTVKMSLVQSYTTRSRIFPEWTPLQALEAVALLCNWPALSKGERTWVELRAAADAPTSLSKLQNKTSLQMPLWALLSCPETALLSFLALSCSWWNEKDWLQSQARDQCTVERVAVLFAYNLCGVAGHFHFCSYEQKVSAFHISLVYLHSL